MKSYILQLFTKSSAVEAAQGRGVGILAIVGILVSFDVEREIGIECPCSTTNNITRPIFDSLVIPSSNTNKMHDGN